MKYFEDTTHLVLCSELEVFSGSVDVADSYRTLVNLAVRVSTSLSRLRAHTVLQACQ